VQALFPAETIVISVSVTLSHLENSSAYQSYIQDSDDDAVDISVLEASMGRLAINRAHRDVLTAVWEQLSVPNVKYDKSYRGGTGCAGTHWCPLACLLYIKVLCSPYVKPKVRPSAI
jgi:hypothetical protein